MNRPSKLAAYFAASRHLVAAGLCGLVLFLSLASLAFMPNRRPQPLSVSQITGAALRFAATEGWSDTGQTAWAVPIEGDEPSIGDRATLPDPLWEVVMLPSLASLVSSLSEGRLNEPMLSFALTPDGTVVQYVEATSNIAGTLQTDSKGRAWPYDELDTSRIFTCPPERRVPLEPGEDLRLLEIASGFFDRHSIAPPASPPAVVVSVQPGTRVGYLAWDSPGPSGTTLSTRVVVANQRVAAYDHDVVAGSITGGATGPQWEAVMRSVVGMLVGLAYFVVLAVVTVLFIVRRRRGEVAVVQGLAVLAVLAIVVLLLLALGLAGPMVETMGQAGQFVMVFVLLAVLLFLGLFGMLGPLTLAGCWAVGEADCHTIWPWRIIGPLSLAVRGRFRQVAVAEQLLAGTWLAGTYLGFEALLALALDRSASSIAGLGALVMLLPGAGAGIKAFYFSATTVLIGGVLIVTLVRRFTRRNWIGVAAGTLIAALPLAVRPTYPGGSVALGAILAFLMTAGALVVFTRTGALAAAAGVYVAVALEGAYPLVLTGNPEHVAGGLLGVALALAPAGIGLLSLWHPAAESETGSVPSYVKKALDRLRIAEEFEVARKVQLRLLPERPPLLPGLDIAGTCVPANEVAGDYFDYFPERDGNLAVAVGDVSGKGVPAALYMTLTKSYMLTQAGAGLDPVRLLSRVNRHLRKNLARGTFVTMAYASIDRESSTLTYARAGHNPPLLVRADGSTECLTASGVALGSSVPSTFESITRSERVVLCRGDVLLLYTDGITEAMNTNGDEYGEERLTASALVAVRKHGSAAAILDAILHDARSFAGRAPQHDDITLVVVRMA